MACLAALAILCVHSAAWARDEPPTAFSKQVTALSGDWAADDWRRGRINMHPSRYTWQSDLFLTVAPPEPVAGRTPMQVLLGYFENETVGGSDTMKVNMHEASELAPGILAKRFTWTYAFSRNLGLWGVITTKADTYIAFNAQCEVGGESSRAKDYPGELCLRKVATLLASLQHGQLRVPEPPTPLNVLGWEGRYGTDGVSVLTSSSFNGLRVASVRASPPMALDAAQVAQAIKDFSDGAVDDNDQAKKNPGTAAWVGGMFDPWLRRTFPDAFDGPSTIMAGATTTPDGRTVLLSVRCPNQGWQRICTYGVEQAKFHIRTGVVEQRRLAAVAATQTPLPTTGVTTEQILGIYATGRFDGSSFVMDGRLFLNDGTVYRDLDTIPAYIDSAATRRGHPETWGSWTRDGDTMAVAWWDGRHERVAATPENLLVGGTPATRMDGYYATVSSGGGLSGSGYVSRSGYRFNADGTFTHSRSSSFAVSGILPGDAAPSTIASGGSNERTAKARYAVDGYMITFTYPDGRIERRTFATYAKDVDDIRRRYILIGGTPFTLEDGRN